MPDGSVAALPVRRCASADRNRGQSRQRDPVHARRDGQPDQGGHVRSVGSAAAHAAAHLRRAQPALQRHRRLGADVDVLLRRQRQSQDQHRPAQSEHLAELRCAESADDYHGSRRRSHPLWLRCEGPPRLRAGSDQSHDDLHVRRARQSRASSRVPTRGSRPTCRMPPATRSDRPMRAVSRRPMSTTRSIGRRLRRSRAAASRSSTTTPRPAARSRRVG